MGNAHFWGSMVRSVGSDALTLAGRADACRPLRNGCCSVRRLCLRCDYFADYKKDFLILPQGREMRRLWLV